MAIELDADLKEMADAEIDKQIDEIIARENFIKAVELAMEEAKQEMIRSISEAHEKCWPDGSELKEEPQVK